MSSDKENKEMFYQNIRKGVKSKARFEPLSTDLDSVINDRTTDWYRSLFIYNEAHKQYLEENGTVSGITDPATNCLYFDFDSKDNIDEARKDAVETAKRLIDRGFPEDSIVAHFTGSKGFSLEVFLNEKITPEEFKNAVFNIAEDLHTFDRVVNDPNRIIRIPNTKHQKSGLYKIPLQLWELDELTINEIKDLSKEPRELEVFPTVADLPNDLKVYERTVIEKTDSVEVDNNFDHKKLDMKQKPKYLDDSRWLLANGFFKSGQRNHAMLCLAATYQNVGYAEEHVKNLLTGVAELQAKRTGEDQFPDDEIDMIIRQVFSDTWRGGQFTTRDPQNWLYQYADEMGVLERIQENDILTISQVQDSFTHFVKNIDENTIKTGIASLDSKLPITTGQNLGIVASAGAGKCHTKGTEVLMFNGDIKKVEDVKVGDLLMGDDSMPRTVLSLARGREELYKVHTDNGSYGVNKSHILSLKNSQEGTLEGVDKDGVINITVEDYLNKSDNFKRRTKGYRTAVKFEATDIPFDAYLIGSLVNSGYEYIPKEYLINSFENRRKLLAGIIDTVGHYDNTMASYELNLKCEQLVKDIQFLCRSLGLKASISRITNRTGETNFEDNYFNLCIVGEEMVNVPIVLESKKYVPNGKQRNPMYYSIEIESIGVGDYYGFELDGNHLYCLADLSVTHNTALALEILKNTSKEGVISVFASLDMHRNRLFEKLLYKVSGGKLSREEIYHKFQTDQAQDLIDLVKRDFGNVWFYDRSSPTIQDIRDYVIKVQKDTGQKVKMVMIDYFERVGSEVSDETASSKKVSGQIQDMLNDLDVAVITLVQPNKFSLSGGPDSPILSYTSIKGSSFLYQSFRSIISLWRPFYTPKTKDMDKYMEMAILKNDLGELDTLQFGWDGKSGMIRELEDIERQELKEWLNMKEAIKNGGDVGDGGWE